jgi:hypothetical protein
MQEEDAMPVKQKRSGAKTQFILSLPADVPAKEVVARAKAKGFDATVHQVHSVRSYARLTKKKTQGEPAARLSNGAATAVRGSTVPKRRTRVTPGRPVSSDRAGGPTSQRPASLEQQLLGIVVQLGLPGAEELFKQVKAKVLALADG